MALLALRTALMAGSASIAARASLCASFVPHGAKLEGRELHSLVKTLKSRAGAGAGTGRAPRLSPDRVSSRQSTSESTSAVPEPNRHQLWAHAVRCAIPMVGFGIIDNVVMITAGERIQSSIGLTLGLTTMAAAGLGQIVSDISGIMSGGTVDALVGRLLPNLPRAGLTSLQKDLTSARIAQTAGGCVGVTVGCLLGMSVLLLLDAEAVERQRTAAELERIFDLVERSAMNTVDRTLGCDMSILWVVDAENDDIIWTRVVADGDVPSDLEIKKTDFVSVIKKTSSSQDLVKKTITTGSVQQVVLGDEGGLIKNMMTVPIVGGDGNILGAIQIVNKKGPGQGFNKQDAMVLSVLCSHIATFFDIMKELNGASATNRPAYQEK